jgi:KDEL-tailed cysteine endopeptidase
MHYTFKYGMSNPIMTESAYPYTGRAATCKYNSNSAGSVRVAGYKMVTANSPSALMAAVSVNPVAIALCARSSNFRYYKSGIMSSTACGTCLDHAVILIGYGTQNGVPFWLVRNSWGTGWGESGYIRILRKTTNDVGICGLQQKNSYPWV